LLVGAVCLGLSWDSNATGERGNATIARAAHHQPSPSSHVNGIAAVVTVVCAARLWSTARVSRVRRRVPAATNLVRPRGPPYFLAY
jgi:hypothetical protein